MQFHLWLLAYFAVLHVNNTCEKDPVPLAGSMLPFRWRIVLDDEIAQTQWELFNSSSGASLDCDVEQRQEKSFLQREPSPSAKEASESWSPGTVLKPTGTTGDLGSRPYLLTVSMPPNRYHDGLP